jgi:HSP20 family molecular chaperone IbpA
LPSSVEAEGADAKVEDGILTIRLPKVEEERPKKIEVKAN